MNWLKLLIAVIKRAGTRSKKHKNDSKLLYGWSGGYKFAPTTVTVSIENEVIPNEGSKE